MSRRGQRNFEGCQIKRLSSNDLSARLECGVTGPEGVVLYQTNVSAATNLKEYAAAHLCGRCAFAGMDASTFNQMRTAEAALEQERLEAELRLLKIRRQVAQEAAELRLLQATVISPDATLNAATTPAIAPPPQEAPVTPPPPAIEGS